MFEGRYSLALSPEGAVTLPPRIRKEMHRLWGDAPQLLCFGAQYLYICQQEQAEALLVRVDKQLCAAFDDLRAVNHYLRRMQDSVALLYPASNGTFRLPRALMQRLGTPRGGLLALLGVDDHLEVWNTEHLKNQTNWLEQQSMVKNPAFTAPENTPICLQPGETPCSLLRGGLPSPRRCGPCVYLRLP